VIPDEPTFTKKKPGTITSPFAFAEDTSNADVLKTESMFLSPGLAEHFRNVRDEPPNMIPRILQPYTSYSQMMEADKEEDITRGLVEATSGYGADRDHPYIQRAVWETLQHRPGLLRTYLSGKVSS
jgi:hypothetical protein